MQLIFLAISSLLTRVLVDAEETCGKWKDPRSPVHFDSTNNGQWRLLATEGQKQDGTIIEGAPPLAVIRGHWAIGELEFFEDPNCEGDKHPSLLNDDDPSWPSPVLAPLHTTFGWQDDTPEGHAFLIETDPPWYSEMRAIDSCHSSEFWSACYQCESGDAWYGVQFKDAEAQVGCLMVFQKDADAYTATKVFLERWMTDADGAGSWVSHGNWTGLTGGRWFILKKDSTVAIAGTHRGTVPGLLGLITALLWAAW